MNKPPIREGKRLYNSSKEAATEIDRLTAEVERLMNGQYDTYAAAREEYRKKIDEQAKEIERLTLNGIHTCSDECQRPLCVARRENARLREAIGALLACPAIADGNHNEPAWADPDTCAAESRARAALKEDTSDKA